MFSIGYLKMTAKDTFLYISSRTISNNGYKYIHKFTVGVRAFVVMCVWGCVCVGADVVLDSAVPICRQRSIRMLYLFI